MKIRFDLPQGYRSDIALAREENDFEGWIQRKFGARIRALIGSDFTLEVHPGHFIIDFTYDDDGFAFMRQFGGRLYD